MNNKEPEAEKANIPASNFSEAFLAAVKTHGFALQERAIALSNKAFTTEFSEWRLESQEFPVKGGPKVTHIDFILTDVGNVHGRKPYLVGECKRSNDGVAWMFYRRRFDRWEVGSDEKLIFEKIQIRKEPFTPAVHTDQPYVKLHKKREIFHGGFAAAKEDKKPFSKQINNSRDIIESPLQQVLRSTMGLADLIMKEAEFINTLGNSQISEILLIPVIVTSARLMGTDSHLDTLDHSPMVSTNQLELVDYPWIFYQYRCTPDIAHSISWRPPNAASFGSLTFILERKYLRSVAIVNEDHFDKFLASITPSQFLRI